MNLIVIRAGSNTKYSNKYPNKIQYLKYLKVFGQILFDKYYLVFGQILEYSTGSNIIQILSNTFFLGWCKVARQAFLPRALGPCIKKAKITTYLDFSLLSMYGS